MYARIAIVGLAIGLTYAVPGQSPGQPAKPADEKPLSILQAAPLKPGPNDDELRKLMIERYNEIAGEVKGIKGFMDTGAFDVSSMDRCYTACGLLVEAKLALNDTPAERIELLGQLVDLSKQFELINQRRYDAGTLRLVELQRARYFRLDAQVRLLQAKRDAEKKNQ